MRMPKREILMGIVILQAGIILGMLADGGWKSISPVSSANAQVIPDPATEQKATNELLKGIDAKLSKLSSQIEAGVKVVPVVDRK